MKKAAGIRTWDSGRGHECEEVEEKVSVLPDQVEAFAAEVDEVVELLRRLVAAVDDVHHV